MNEIILTILCVVIGVCALVVLFRMPSEFLNEFESSCAESIQRRNKEFEEKEKMNRELKNWIFK